MVAFETYSPLRQLARLREQQMLSALTPPALLLADSVSAETAVKTGESRPKAGEHMVETGEGRTPRPRKL